ncbi:hypothetical protein TWF694_005119 [Orbilia ellipsospora]|uniref:Uncharacterized protein n=1 Tax=Orbilia ellipsospora TaxID=2528407 RepID=A0AAV9WUM3_9PEZI
MSEELPIVIPPEAPPLDPNIRLNELKRMLENPNTDQRQLPNIRAVIAALEAGEKPAEIYQFGVGITVRELKVTEPSWYEGPATRFFNATTYGPQSGGMIRLQVKLPGGGGLAILPIQVLDDTGSTHLTLYPSDVQLLGYTQTMLNLVSPISLTSSQGLVGPFPFVWVDCRLLDQDSAQPIGPWFLETAIVSPMIPGVPRLSGSKLPLNSSPYGFDKKTVQKKSSKVTASYICCP